jgi:arsenite methyltransferase
MTTGTRQLDTTELEQRVKGMYEEVALEPDREFHFETGRPLAERLGYPAADLDRIPAAAIDSFAGVGYFLDLAAIKPGEVVLDLGSGSGTDSFLAALAVGSSGRVIGIDMTDQQLDKASRLAVEGGSGNVDFRAGYIERPPVEPEGFDCAISNGVVNLSPDKRAVFAAAARALRPGGRLALADIVTDTQLPEGVTCDASLWAACIGGAMQIGGYARAARSSRGASSSVRTRPSWRRSSRLSSALQSSTIRPVSMRLMVMPLISARRPRLDPVMTQRLTTRSPCAIWSTTRIWRSSNRAR